MLRLLVVTFLVTSAVAACSRAVSGRALTLNGRWQSTGYQCPAGIMHREVIDIVQHGPHLVATKLVGDKCVGRGHRTFQGVMTGTTGRVDCWLGSIGGTPSISVRGAPLAVLSPNRFTVDFSGDTVTYTRTQTPTPTARASIWWVWLLLVLLIAVVSLTFTLRRIRARRALSRRGGGPPRSLRGDR